MHGVTEVEHGVAGAALDAEALASEFGDQFAALVVLGLVQEQGAAEVGAQAQPRPGADALVDMVAIGLAAGIAVEGRRPDLLGQRGAEEQQMALQRAQQQLLQLLA